MAEEIIIKVTLDTKDVDVGAQKIKRAVENAIAPSTDHIKRLTSATSGLRSALGALVGIAAFKQIAQFGIDLDRSRNAMTALTGSVEKANKKIAELRELAKASPGVTTSFATQLFQQLSAVGGIADKTINQVVKSLGRLNTVFSDVGPEFARNLIQIFQQGFERSDIKEALGRVPIFEQLLESAFGTKDPEKLRKAKEAGKITLGGFLSGLSNAIDTDPRFKNIQESLGGKTAKAFDEVRQKLAELGEKALRDLLPALERLLPVVTKLLDVFTKLPTGIQAATLAFIAMPGPITGAVSAVRTLTTAFLGLGRAMQASLGIVGLVLVGGGVAVQGFQAMMESNDAQVRARLASMSRNIDSPGSDVVIGDPAATAAARAMSSSEILAQMDRLRKVSPSPRTASGLDFSNLAGGGSGRAARQRDATAAEVAEIIRKINEGREELGRDLIRSLEVFEEELRKGVMETEKDLAAFRVKRLKEQRETRVRLTREINEREERELAELQRTSQRAFRRSGAFIEDAISRGQITGAEAELLKQSAALRRGGELRQALERAQAQGASGIVLDDLREEIELFDRLGTSINDTDRFMRGFNSQVGSVGDAFERFGANVSRAFGNVRDLFNGLKQAVLGFFNDLLGQSLQNLVRGVLGPIFGGGGGGAGGVGGFFRQAFGGGGLEAPPSVSGGVAGSISGIARSIPGLGPIFGASGGGGAVAGTAGATRAGGFGGFNFGGLGDSLLSAAPLLGLSIGASLGGQSRAGNILGAAGGLLTSTFISTTLGAPGALGSLAPALFSNPVTAIAGVGLLVGSVLLGKAKQRRKDEEASGQMLAQALQGIDQLAAGISGGQIDGGQARAIFDRDILGVFRQQIGTLKTKSVRESRLTNQVRDLEKVYQARIPPLIAEQEAKRLRLSENAARFSRQIPEFATGGTTLGGLAFLHPGEKVLNFQQQLGVIRQSNPHVFERAGVPGVQQNAIFDRGGTFRGGGLDLPIEINLDVSMFVGKDDQTRIVVNGGSTTKGRAVTVNNVKIARTNREL